MKAPVLNIKPAADRVEELAGRVAEISTQLEALPDLIADAFTEALKPLANALGENLKNARDGAGITVHSHQRKTPSDAGFKLPKADDKSREVIGNNLYKLPKAG